MKVTKEFLESEIISVDYVRGAGTITHCYITVKNKFIFMGKSACIDENEFDEEIGRKFAYEDTFNQMWEVYGFYLMQKAYEEKKG